MINLSFVVKNLIFQTTSRIMQGNW